MSELQRRVDLFKGDSVQLVLRWRIAVFLLCLTSSL